MMGIQYGCIHQLLDGEPSMVSKSSHPMKYIESTSETIYFGTELWHISFGIY